MTILIFQISILLPFVLFICNFAGQLSFKWRIVFTVLVLICCFIDAALLRLIFIEEITYQKILSRVFFYGFWAAMAVSVVLPIWCGMKKKSIRLLCCLLPLSMLVGIGGTYLLEAREKAIPTVSTDEYETLNRYYPGAENSLVATLDEESTLTLKDDLPRMDGATALYPVYAAFANAVYPKESIGYPYKEDVPVICTTTSNAYESIIRGDTDIIFVAAPSQEQEEAAKRAGVSLTFTPIGKEAFVFFVNSKNPIENLSVEQIQGIYSGSITKWEALGVKNFGSIRPFQREEGSGSQSALQRMMGDIPIMEAEITQTVTFMEGILTQVADYKNYKNAIGYSFRFYSTEMVKNGQIKLLSLNGVYPSKESIADGSYPVASEFYAVTRSDADDNTKALLAWIQGSQGQALVEKTGYNPLIG